MKRSDDFRTYMSNVQSVEESVSYFPDLGFPYGIDYLEEVASEFPIARSPYEPSNIRDAGLKIWDSVFLPYPKSLKLDFKRQNELSSLRSVNSCWNKTKDSLNMIGRPDGEHYIRPKGEFVLDILNDDIRMLQGAHVITHRQNRISTRDDYSFGVLSDSFLRNLVKLFLARKYGLLINTGESAEDDSFSRYGIEVFGSTDLRSPIMMAAAQGDNCRLKHDSTAVAVLGSIGIEPSPKQASRDDSWIESDKWSCMPTLVALAGWECVDYVTHAERVELRDTPYFAVPCTDLQGMDSFSEMIETAREFRGDPERSEHVFSVDEWLKSTDFEKGLEFTPQLPCPECIRIPSKSFGAVPKPRCKKPKKPFKEIAGSTVPEVKAWSDYVRFVRNCISIGRKATAFASGSVTRMKRRNANFKKISEKIEKISRMTERMNSKLESGFFSEAECLKNKIDNMRKELQ